MIFPMTGTEPGEDENLTAVLDERAAGDHGSHIAVRTAHERMTYRQLLASSCRYGNALRALGAGPGTRILLALRDSPQFMSTFLGAIRLGALPFLVSPDVLAVDRSHYLADSAAELVIVERASEGREATPTVSIEELTSCAAEQPELLAPAAAAGRDPAFVLYSSGSTGQPKGAVHSHRGPRLAFESFGREVLGISPSDVVLSAGKLCHSYGLGNSLWLPIFAGATVILDPRRPTPRVVKELAGAHRATILFLIPSLCAALAADSADLGWAAGLRACVSASEPLGPEVWSRWTATIGVPLLDGIGATEMLYFYCANRIDRMTPGAAGVPVPGCEVTLVDESGRPIDGAGTGRLLARSEEMFLEYWHQPDRTRSALLDGRFDTRDIVERDQDGILWYRGRADEQFKIGGLWVSPTRVEACLERHPAVREAGVVGIVLGGGMRVRAVVLAEDGTDLTRLRQELRVLCARELRTHELPHVIDFAAQLPRTVTGKLRRFELAGAVPGEPGTRRE
jgi:acyl-coenzyme A synthetase/AMP-(fatty) acid ligase